MTCHYPVLGNASDWSCCEGNLLQPIRSITQIWVATGHQYGIPALVSQKSFREETRSGVAKCRQFSQTTCIPDHSCNLARATHPSTQLKYKTPRRWRPLKRRLKSEFALFQSLSRLLQLICKCKRTLLSRIPKNHTQVRKEKENLAVACLRPP